MNKKIYERNINSFVTELDNQQYHVEVSMLDLNHSMRIWFNLDIRTKVIVDAHAEITKAPLQICQEPQALIKKLIGIKVERGINKRLVMALGGPLGCTHLYELALHGVRLIFNVTLGKQFDWEQWVNRSIDEEEFVTRAKPILANSCRPFKIDEN